MFFKNKLFIISVLIIAIVFFIAISAGNTSINILGNTVTIPSTPLQNVFSNGWYKVRNTVSFIQDMHKLDDENKKLKEQLDKINKEKRELENYKKENTDLKKLLNFKDQLKSYNFVGANIVGKDMGNWFSVITIDRGSNDHVRVNDPVISSSGLVGKVISVGVNSSKVLCIIDTDSSVTALIFKSRDDVIIKGDLTLKLLGYCKMELIPPDSDVKYGDIIETSGIGGVFPKGITIGHVMEVRSTDNGMNRYAVIKPSVDFRRLEEVSVLTGGKTIRNDLDDK